MLEFLLTKPRLTYLAKVRNPNPAMPDYDKEGPLSFQTYKQKSGDPFEHEAAEGKAEGLSLHSCRALVWPLPWLWMTAPSLQRSAP